MRVSSPSDTQPETRRDRRQGLGPACRSPALCTTHQLLKQPPVMTEVDAKSQSVSSEQNAGPGSCQVINQKVPTQMNGQYAPFCSGFRSPRCLVTPGFQPGSIRWQGTEGWDGRAGPGQTALQSSRW